MEGGGGARSGGSAASPDAALRALATPYLTGADGRALLVPGIAPRHLSLPHHANCSFPVAASSLLTITKLAPPRVGVGSIMRKRLIALLQQSRGARLALVVGGAGFGKTTLLAQWRKEIMRRGSESVWLTLGQDDTGLPQLHAYLTAGLRDAGIPVDDEPALVGETADTSVVVTIGTLLVNALARRSRELHVFVDDYHHVADARVDGLIQFLAEYGPEGLCLVIASRSRPALSLGKLRVMQQVVELGQSAMPFDYSETVAFLNASLRPPCSPGQARLIHELTGGWPAGLRLLALAWKARVPEAVDLRGLLGKTADLDAYLDEEVLAHLPAHIVDFAEQVAACRRFCPQLAAAMTNAGDPQALIDALEHGNMFTVRLDARDGHDWYRFHGLFAEYLQKRLMRRDPALVRQLHLKACRWYVDAGILSEAVRHAHEADDLNLAIALVERADLVGTMSNLGPLLQWMTNLPGTTLRSHPRLLLQGCVALMLTARTALAQTWLEEFMASDADKDPETVLQARIIQGAVALNQDDSARAIDMLAPIVVEAASIPLWQSLHATVLGTAYAACGRYADARRLHRERARSKAAAASNSMTLLEDTAHALGFLVAGEVNETVRLASRTLGESERAQGRHSVSANVAAAFLADAYYELDRLDDARDILSERLALFRYSSPEPSIRAALCYGRLQRLQRSLRAAASFLARTEEHFRSLHLHRGVAHMLAEQVAIALSQGDHTRALRLQRRLEAVAGEIPDPSGFQAEIPIVTAMSAARMAIALHSPRDALARLSPAAQYAGLTRRARLGIQVQLLRAQALDALGQRSEASDAVRDAIAGGHRLGLVRSFLDAGAFLRDHLDGWQPDPGNSEDVRRYVDVLCAGFEAVRPTRDVAAVAHASGVDGASAALTSRERDVLELMEQSMSNKRIASTLGLSVETVKWNIKNIFGKLGVSSRYDAIAWIRARAPGHQASSGDREA